MEDFKMYSMRMYDFGESGIFDEKKIDSEYNHSNDNMNWTF